MVGNTFISFVEFIAKVIAIEKYPFGHFTKLWTMGLLDITLNGNVYTASNYFDRKFLPYPYQINYISKLVNWQSGYSRVKDKYLTWISDICKENPNANEKELADILIHSKVPIYYDEKQRPTFEQFFEERIAPFINSSITEEDYNLYYDNQVVIGLERNTHVILNTPDNPQLKIGRIEYEQGMPVILMGPWEPTNQIYVKYDDGRCIFLGDEEYGMYSEEIIKAQLNTSGTAYLFDNLNLE